MSMMAEEDEPDAGSVTAWIEALKEGHPRAAEALWRYYFERVVRMARRRLQAAPHQAVEDAEDAALGRLPGPAHGSGPGPIPPPQGSGRPLAAPDRHHRQEGPQPEAAAFPAQARRPPWPRQGRGGRSRRAATISALPAPSRGPPGP